MIREKTGEETETLGIAGETLLMLLILLILGKEKRKVFALRMLSIAAVMGNVCFFGMPVVRALFPEAPEAAVYSSMFNAALNILAWTVGVFTLTGEKKPEDGTSEYLVLLRKKV